MRITALSLENFRTYSQAAYTFEQPLTIVTGKNAAGKSNLLEAIRLLSTTRSVHARQESQVVRHGSTVARLVATIETQGNSQELLCGIEHSDGRTKKIWRLQGVPKSSRFIVGLLATLLFKPQDVDVLHNSSSARRDLLDQLLVVRNPELFSDFRALRGVLTQRQALLERVRSDPGKIMSDLYDDQLVRLGARISLARQQLLHQLEPHIAHYLGQLQDKKISSCVRLTSPLRKDDLSGEAPQTEEEWQDVYRRGVQQLHDREIAAARNLVGPHREDLQVVINRWSVREFGSRGEWRSVVISFVLASLDYLEERLDERPVLLLDDVFSELDRRRRAVLVPLLRRQQTILTTADPAELPKLVQAAPRIELSQDSTATAKGIAAATVDPAHDNVAVTNQL